MAASLKTVTFYLGCFVSVCIVALLDFFLKSERDIPPVTRKTMNPYSTLPGALTLIDLQTEADSTLPEAADDYVLFSYSYKNINTNLTEKGKVLPAPKWVLKKHQMPLEYLGTLNADNVHQFVFVMGCTADHFNESMDAIWTIQEHFPTYQVMYYDWGLDPWQVELLHTLCKVTHRPFNISSYPAFKVQFGRSKFQSSKIFCIMDALITNSGVFWIDASIRFTNATVFSLLYNDVIKNGGFAFMSHCDHSSFAVTHPRMYKYLPTDMELQKQLYQGATNAVLMYKTRKVFDNIMWWWFLCSLTADCMTPIRNLGCKFKNGDRKRTFAHCHRFDQSATNILAHNLYDHNDNNYNFEGEIKSQGGFKIMRGSSGLYAPKRCTKETAPV